MRKLFTVLNAVSLDQVPWQTEPLSSMEGSDDHFSCGNQGRHRCPAQAGRGNRKRARTGTCATRHARTRTLVHPGPGRQRTCLQPRRKLSRPGPPSSHPELSAWSRGAGSLHEGARPPTPCRQMRAAGARPGVGNALGRLEVCVQTAGAIRTPGSRLVKQKAMARRSNRTRLWLWPESASDSCLSHSLSTSRKLPSSSFPCGRGL